MRTSFRSGLLGAVALTAALDLGGVARASPGTWSAGVGTGRLVVHVLKKGLLSGLAHDHHLLATDWSVTAAFDDPGEAPARFEVLVRAGSLRDQQPALSPEERAKVDRQAARILDAEGFPEIRFESERPLAGLAPGGSRDGPLDGLLDGRLTLHGVRRPLAVPVRAVREGRGWRVRGAVRFKQRDFGIEPYSGFLGTIAVHDEVEVELDLLLAPETKNPANGTSAGGAE